MMHQPASTRNHAAAYSSQEARPDKYKGLKSQPHAANGGIGVSYSNVMLGGVPTVADSGALVPDSTY